MDANVELSSLNASVTRTEIKGFYPLKTLTFGAKLCWQMAPVF